MRSHFVTGALVTMALGSAAAAQPLPAGTIITWGDGGGLTPVPAGTYIKIAAGPTHALALGPGGNIVGWGENTHGQATPPPGTFKDIAAGGTGIEGISFGVLMDGTPVAWGFTSALPPAPPGIFNKVRAKYEYAVLIRSDGTLAYWGPPTNPVSNLPTGAFLDVSPGREHAVGRGNFPGGWLAWGDNTHGQAVIPPGSWESIVAGAAHNIGIRFVSQPCCSGELSGWGDNAAGQTTVPPGAFVRAGAGDDWSAAISTGHVSQLVTWGGAPAQQPIPPETYIKQIEVGSTFGIALTGCYPDCNTDGSLTVADFGSFRTIFILGSFVRGADCNGDGLLTAADWGCFQTRFVVGCP